MGSLTPMFSPPWFSRLAVCQGGCAVPFFVTQEELLALARLLAPLLAAEMRREGEERPSRPPLPILIGIREAARLAGITEEALRSRLKRHLVPGTVREGRRIQFHRERFLAGLDRKAR